MSSSKKQNMTNTTEQIQYNKSATADKNMNDFARKDVMRMINPTKQRTHLAHVRTAFAFLAVAFLLMILAIYLGATMNFGGAAIATIFSLLLFSISQGLVRVEYNVPNSMDCRIW